jgi:hypothetical protein
MPRILNATALSANTTPAYYTASANSNNSTAWQAFDQANGTYWAPATNGATEWIKLDLGIDFVADAIAIMCNTGFGLTSFTWAGSQNDSTYTSLATPSGLSGWSSGSFQTFTYSNTSFYRYYKLTCTGQGGSPVQIAEIQIQTVDSSALSIANGGSSIFDPTSNSTLVGTVTNLYNYPGSTNVLSSIDYNTPREGQIWPRPPFA